mmetsp:Transcript_40669/g.99925  ORF Transcript_40669/g.99925 Transcript_40669/m.99925 type:complete len:275 (+) Transcript_40669:253-1077(+)
MLLFNMGRADVGWSLLLAVLLMGGALAGRHLSPAAQDTSSFGTRYAYIYASVTAAAIVSVVILMMTLVKCVCGHGNCSPCLSRDKAREGYEPLADGAGASPVRAQPNFYAGGNSSIYSYQGGPTQGGLVQDEGMGRMSERLDLAGRHESVVSAGIVVEREARPFMHCGVAHVGGLYRVARVAEDSPCHRQGAAYLGDVILSVNGIDLAPLLETEAARLLQGPAGSTLVVRLFSGPGRVPFDRHLVLAPSPSSLRWTASAAQYVPYSPRQMREYV